MIKRKLSIQAIGAIILSAILFTMPIGAIFMNSTMVTPAHAEELAEGEITENTGEENTDTNQDNQDENADGENQNDDSSNTDDGASDNGSDDGTGDVSGGDEGDGNETEEPAKLTCTCTTLCWQI